MRNRMTVRDLAVLFGRLRAIRLGEDPDTAPPLTDKTIYTFLDRSRHGRRPNTPPMPEPVAGSRTLFWEPDEGETMDDLVAQMTAWYQSRDYSREDRFLGRDTSPSPVRTRKVRRH